VIAAATGRAELIADFLGEAGFAEAPVAPLAGAASTRR
jgi:hypothetical protein